MSRILKHNLYKETAVTCPHCGWQGLGKELSLGELFEQLAEHNCPKCDEAIVIVPYPMQ